MTRLQDAFTATRNAMVKALLEAGVDPLATGAVMAHSERLGFALARIENRLDRLEQRITRQETRQKGKKPQEPTGSNVVAFPKVTSDVPVLSGA
jgi:hypothetical protein